MRERNSLTAADGHRFEAYRSRPEGDSRAGLVVIQEVFGVNAHIEAVCDGFAKEGFAVVAPALFDRARRNVALDYDDAGLASGRALRLEIGWDAPLRDVDAAVASLAAAGKVGVVGYCWGGSLAWLAATRLGVACAVCYYGGQIIAFKDERPGCPVMMHFGDSDRFIPGPDVAAIRAAQPEAKIFSYTADHGFNCDQREDFDPQCAATARSRSLAFVAEHLG